MDVDRSVSAAKALQAARRDASARLRELDSRLVAGSRLALARSRALLEQTRPLTSTPAAAPVAVPPPALAPPDLAPPPIAPPPPILVTPPKRGRHALVSLQVVLSPAEEIALRRIAHCSLAKLQPPAVERLQQLNLIQMQRGAYALTPLGQRRFERLPKPARLATDLQLNGLLRILDNVRLADPKT